MTALNLSTLTKEEKTVFQVKIKEAAVQIDKDTFQPYKVIDGERYDIELGLKNNI